MPGSSKPSKARIRELERAGKKGEAQAKRAERALRPVARDARRAELDRIKERERRIAEAKRIAEARPDDGPEAA
jgi:hypothetical protein